MPEGATAVLPTGTGTEPAKAAAPERFEINGQLMTLAEAQAALKATAELKASVEKLTRENGTYKNFYNATAQMLQGDQNAFRAVAKATGKLTDEQIEAGVATIAGGGRKADEDDGDDDVDDIRGAAKTVAELKAELANVKGELVTLKQHTSKLTDFSNGSWEQQVSRDINAAIDTDDILGSVVKTRANLKGVQRLRAAAIEEATKVARARGGLDRDALQAGVAKARTFADEFGWLNTDADGAMPTAGGGSGVLPTTEFKPSKTPVEVSPSSPDFAQMLGTAMATFNHNHKDLT